MASGTRTRSWLLALCGAALIPTSVAPLQAQSGRATAAKAKSDAARPAVARPARDPALEAEIARRAGSDLRSFYAARGHRPLWIESRRLSPAAALLLERLETAEYDRIKPRKLKPGSLARALNKARESGSPADLAKAEVALSKSYVAYVKALRSAPRAPMIYESQALSPVVPTTSAALQAATKAGSLETHLRTMGWMHPLYAPLRDALADPRLAPAQRHQIALNLDRVRAIPANPARRYVLIDTVSARLWMYQDGKPVDTMRVVVGKPEETTQTPMMAGFIRYAIANPYWNVPEDLVRSRIAWNVVNKGLGYLRESRYQVLSDWTDGAKPIPPETIDWHAVEAGAFTPRVRQLPGGSNFMGSVKFLFPNDQGIFLHDTPDKHLLRESARQFSSGCVRLEDAQRLGRWLLKRPLPKRLRAPEQRIALPELVPVFITYLTAMPEAGRIAFRDDVYARDALGDRRLLARSDRRQADRP